MVVTCRHYRAGKYSIQAVGEIHIALLNSSICSLDVCVFVREILIGTRSYSALG